MPVNADVFVNVPFDPEYEPLFIALISGLASLGLRPRSVLEVTTTKDRLNRLVSLLETTSFSVHDISRVQLSGKSHRLPRFNMPFELGLAVAVAQLAKKRSWNHEWRVFEAVNYRLQTSLSDLNGYDPLIHGGTPDGMLRKLREAFVRARGQPSLAAMQRSWKELRRYVHRQRRRGEFDDLYNAATFYEIVVAAEAIDAEFA